MTDKSAKKRVMATGVFDLLHPGHIYYLEQSKRLGDELVVVVANDAVVRRSKPQPLFEAASRAHMVQSLACVDKVMVPTETEPQRYYRTVQAVAPDIITLGYDQNFDVAQLAAELATYGWQGQVIRIGQYPEQPISSSQLKAQIKGRS